MAINKGITISLLVKELEQLKAQVGDVEVTTMNEKEFTCDFIERAIVITGASKGKNTPVGFQVVALMRGKDYLQL